MIHTVLVLCSYDVVPRERMRRVHHRQLHQLQPLSALLSPILQDFANSLASWLLLIRNHKCLLLYFLATSLASSLADQALRLSSDSLAPGFFCFYLSLVFVYSAIQLHNFTIYYAFNLSTKVKAREWGFLTYLIFDKQAYCSTLHFIIDER